MKLTNDATRASVGALPHSQTGTAISDLSALVLGRQIGEARRRIDELETKGMAAGRSKDHTAKVYLESAEQDGHDRELALKEMLSHVRASTLSEAAIQIAETVHLVDLVRDRFPEDAETSIAADVRAINRLLFSVLMLVNGLADRKLTETADPDFGSWNLNPWVPVEERIENVKACSDASRGDAQ